MGTFVSSTQVGESVNYGATSLTASGTYTKNQYIILGYFTGAGSGATSINPETVNWVRTRALPPSNVMPSVSFGGVAGGGSNPPSGPTDTLGDSFTLGASQSVSYGNTPSVVQQRYASNCKSSSCGLAYTSSVTAGNTLAFALGWYGQNPPSTPTDTL